MPALCFMLFIPYYAKNYASIIDASLLKSEVSITLPCQLCSTRYAAFRIKNCSKSTSAIHVYLKKWCRVPPLYQLSYEKLSIHYATCYAAFQIENCLKSTSAIKIATMTNTDNFHYKGKPSHAIAKSTLFAVSKDEWDTKEDTG